MNEASVALYRDRPDTPLGEATEDARQDSARWHAALDVIAGQGMNVRPR